MTPSKDVSVRSSIISVVMLQVHLLRTPSFTAICLDCRPTNYSIFTVNSQKNEREHWNTFCSSRLNISITKFGFNRVHPYIKILPLFIYPYVAPNPYVFLCSVEHKRRC